MTTKVKLFDLFTREDGRGLWFVVQTNPTPKCLIIIHKNGILSDTPNTYEYDDDKFKRKNIINMESILRTINL